MPELHDWTANGNNNNDTWGTDHITTRERERERPLFEAKSVLIHAILDATFGFLNGMRRVMNVRYQDDVGMNEF